MRGGSCSLGTTRRCREGGSRSLLTMRRHMWGASCSLGTTGRCREGGSRSLLTMRHRTRGASRSLGRWSRCTEGASCSLRTMRRRMEVRSRSPGESKGCLAAPGCGTRSQSMSGGLDSEAQRVVLPEPRATPWVAGCIPLCGLKGRARKPYSIPPRWGSSLKMGAPSTQPVGLGSGSPGLQPGRRRPPLYPSSYFWRRSSPGLHSFVPTHPRSAVHRIPSPASGAMRSEASPGSPSAHVAKPISAISRLSG